MVNNMNRGHATLSDWGMSHLENITPEEILDIGCGGGRNAYELLKKYYLSNVTAVDYSDVSVEKSTEFNEEMIKKGRCIVQKDQNVSDYKTTYKEETPEEDTEAS